MRFRISQECFAEMSDPHVYEVRPRKDGHGFYLISERLPFGRLWYHKAADAVDDAKCYSRSHGAIIRVFDESGAVIETHEYAGAFKEPESR